MKLTVAFNLEDLDRDPPEMQPAEAAIGLFRGEIHLEFGFHKFLIEIRRDVEVPVISHDTIKPAAKVHPRHIPDHDYRRVERFPG